MRARHLLAGFVLLLVPLTAGAVDIFVNGENVTGVQNITIVNAQVRIDGRGNVYIDSPGYTVRRVARPQPIPPGNGPLRPPAGPPLARRYYVVTSQTGPGLAQFDVEIFVNDQSAGRSSSDGAPLIDSITRFLHAGANQIRIVARKNVAGVRRSASSADTHRVIIGEGTEEGGRVILRVPLVDFSVNASQTADQSANYQITAQ